MEDLIRLEEFVDRKHLPFFIRPLLTEKNRSRKYRDPHRHKYHEVLYFKSGEALQNIDDKLIKLETENTFCLISRGQIHDFIKGKNMKGYLLRFDNEIIPHQRKSEAQTISTIMETISKIDTIVLDKQEAASFEAILDLIYQEYLKPVDAFGRQSMIVHLLLTLLIKLSREYNKIVSTDENLIVSPEKKIYFKFLDLLEENLSNHHEVDFYANALGVSKKKLSAITLKIKGMACKSIIVDRLIVEAKRLLLYSYVSSKEISYTLGFTSPAYFSRLFKSKTGKSPNEFKMDALNKEKSFS